MKRKWMALLALGMAVCACALSWTGCDRWSDLFRGESDSVSAEEKTIAFVASATETAVVIKVEKAAEGATLLEVMNSLEEEEALSFEIANGMITEINGRANDADYNPCWMLYTSDVEMANSAWGAYEYDGELFWGAIVGAETLPVVDGGVYIWAYQAF